MCQNSRIRHFSEIKALAGASHRRSPFQNLPQENSFIFTEISQINFFQRKNIDFVDDLPIKIYPLPKTKMVRMVLTNNFCGIGLNNCGPKDELWMKTEMLEGWECSKFSVEVQGGVPRVFIIPKYISKTFWTIPDPF